MSAAFGQLVDAVLGGLPLPEVAAERALGAGTPSERRRERDRLLRDAARRLPGPEWRQAGSLHAWARRLQRLPRPVAPGLEDVPELVAAALALGGGRVPSRRTIFRALCVTDSATGDLSVGPVGASREGGNMSIDFMQDEREKFIRGACASLFQRAGLTDMLRAAQKTVRLASQLADVATDPGEFRGASLVDLARHALTLNGVKTRGLNADALVKEALLARAGMNTTSDFAVLLETAARKVFLGAYATAPTTWPSWCGRVSLRDFRPTGFFRRGSIGSLDSLTEAGEVKHKSIPDGQKATLAAGTKGNIIGITRKALVNDDLGAFADLIPALAEAAAFSVEDDAAALVLANSGLGPTQADGQPLFHANRANIGTAGAMSVATWGGAAAVMAKQKDVSGVRTLGLQPAVWLGPVDLRLSAKTLTANATDPAAPVSGAANPVQGLVRDVVGAPWLSGTRHYFLADPAIFPAFGVGFIDGNEAPVIETGHPFDSDGVQFKVVFDYAVGVLDYRPAVTAPGA